MSTTGLEVFDGTVQKTNSWLTDLTQILRWPDKHKVYSALRTTLHALRDRLTIEEVARQSLVRPEKFVADERDAWSEHQPSTPDENEFIRAHGFREYSKWHLGIDDERDEETKQRYKFPYSDFNKVHRCAVLTAKSRAGEYKHFDIETAAAHLHGMIDSAKPAERRRARAAHR